MLVCVERLKLAEISLNECYYEYTIVFENGSLALCAHMRFCMLNMKGWCVCVYVCVNMCVKIEVYVM